MEAAGEKKREEAVLFSREYAQKRSSPPHQQGKHLQQDDDARVGS